MNSKGSYSGLTERMGEMAVEPLLAALGTSMRGLSDEEARKRLVGNRQPRDGHRTWPLLLLRQFNGPITVILLIAAVLSYFLHDRGNAAIILVIVLISGMLSYWQEWRAGAAVQKLMEMIRMTSTVIRDGRQVEVPREEVVPGDVVQLNAGDTLPADCRILVARDLFVDEATLTGESLPVEKSATGPVPNHALLGQPNCLFLGTHIVSGEATAVVVATGDATQLGQISRHLQSPSPETDFEHGVRRFGYMLMDITLVLVTGIFLINVLFDRPVVEAFLFSVALAVGLTPQLLPAIIAVNLSHGARHMARLGVLVRRLVSIEDFGAMSLLCSDKTGTLTQGKVQLHQAISADGADSAKVRLYAYLNAKFESGFSNPIDEALRAVPVEGHESFSKLDESPYDFVRKRLSVLTAGPGGHFLVTKGAVEQVLAVCTTVESTDGSISPLEPLRSSIRGRYEALGTEGYRTLAVCYRRLPDQNHAGKDEEREMTFLGFLVFSDPLQEGVRDTIDSLRRVGVTLKMITGDNRRVAARIGSEVGLASDRVISGVELNQMTDAALVRQVNHVDVFAEVEPNQKERIIRACQRAGHVVGYIGDGINDATALHAADVGISVDQAVDVAKEAADIVLLRRNLSVLLDGIVAGRQTFANTMKYIFMATSANFGNMFSMAGASLIVPFLPLLPKQILLMNLLTDLPEMMIAGDSTDPEMVARPQRWDLHFVRRFMLVFGALSSLFDFVMFGLLWYGIQAKPEMFRTGWFLESVVSAILVVLVVRTRRIFLRSKPSKGLLIGSIAMLMVTLSLPFWPGVEAIGFVRPSFVVWISVVGVVLSYVLAAEICKRWFYRWTNHTLGTPTSPRNLVGTSE